MESLRNWRVTLSSALILTTLWLAGCELPEEPNYCYPKDFPESTTILRDASGLYTITIEGHSVGPVDKNEISATIFLLIGCYPQLQMSENDGKFTILNPVDYSQVGMPNTPQDQSMAITK